MTTLLAASRNVHYQTTASDRLLLVSLRIFDEVTIPTRTLPVPVFCLARNGRNKCPPRQHFLNGAEKIGSHPHFRYTSVTSCCKKAVYLIDIRKQTKEYQL